MAFCKGVMSTIKRLYNKISPELGKIIDEVTKYTKLLKDLGDNPMVEAILKVIPGGSKIEKWLDIALAEITDVTDETKTLAEKLSEWLSSAPTELDRNSKLFKLAAVASKAADVHELGKQPMAEHVYDSAVDLRIIVNKTNELEPNTDS